ncbi:sodium-dependent glucose transporter 1-like [Ylistrum balloti]|uniref:sodium-dependent glucose transporter 1-like n=1 Tax=Ylistrum balloti TaxID=509963 RepID=UPI0029058B29|nr:sodium-dependent glucose transporter 1-like [Ylistrum balloti]
MEKEIKYGVPSSELDTVPMQEIVKEKNCKNVNKRKKSFRDDVLTSKTVQSQIVRSVCVSAAYMITGWTKGLIGPAFPDIMMISGADLENGSLFMTALYTGLLLGSVGGGVIYSKIDKYLLFTVSLVLYSVMVALIPWCSSYQLMVVAHAFLGVCGGLTSVGVGFESIAIWGPTPRGRSYLLVNSAAYAISSVISPLATAPFLLKHSVSINSNNSSWNSTSSVQSFYTTINNTNQSYIIDMELFNNNITTPSKSSKLYIAYTISAVLGLTIALLFFILFCQQGSVTIQKSSSDQLKFIGKYSLHLKRLQLFNISVFSVIQNAVDFTFTGYLATFCINYLGWTKTIAATITSVAFFTRLLGTTSGIFLLRYFRTHQLLLSATVASTVGFIGFTICAHVHFDVGIWISLCVIGIPYGLLWPNMLSWINEYLIPMRSEMAGLMNFTAGLGALLAPLLLGYLMEHVSLLWFCYLFCSKSLILTGNSVLMFVYTMPKDTK